MSLDDIKYSLKRMRFTLFVKQVIQLNNNYNELSRRAAKGDKDAQKAIFEMAEQCEKDKSFKKAAELYREAAMDYRIAAFRNKMRTESPESSDNRVARELALKDYVRNIYDRWIDSHPKGMHELPYDSQGLKRSEIYVFFQKGLHYEDDFNNVFNFFGEEVFGKEWNIVDPERRGKDLLMHLLEACFGFKDLPGINFVSKLSTSIRVCLDLFADEIIKRYQNNQSNVSIEDT